MATCIKYLKISMPSDPVLETFLWKTNQSVDRVLYTDVCHRVVHKRGKLQKKKKSKNRLKFMLYRLMEYYAAIKAIKKLISKTI